MCGDRYWQSNLIAVWGQIVMGVEYTSFTVSMSVLDAPYLTKKSFTTIENELDNDHGLFLKKQAGAIERAIIFLIEGTTKE